MNPLHIMACIILILIVILIILSINANSYNYNKKDSKIIDSYVSARISLDNMNNIIPNNFIQTLKHNRIYTDFYEQLLKHNMNMCPEFNFYFFTDETIRLIIRENFPQYVYNAYMKINPRFGACLSDFGRYCLLYVLGGIYLDIKSEVVKPLYPFVDRISQQSISSDILVVSHWRDINPQWERFGSKGEIMNWVIICSPRHPVIRELIERMVRKIESGYNGFDKLFVLETTGPILLTETIIDMYLNYHTTIIITDEINDYFEYMSYRCTGHYDCRSLYYSYMKAQPYDTIRMPVLLKKPRIK